MKRNRLKSIATSIALAASVGLLAPTPASAEVTHIFEAGQLTGATGVVVGDDVYNVSFVDGNFNTLFPSSEPLAFTNFDDARGASQALADSVFLDGIDGRDYLSDFTLTSGITRLSSAVILTPYARSSSEAFHSRYIRSIDNDGLLSDEVADSSFETILTFNTGPRGSSVYAAWERTSSSIVTAVPEPSTYAMMVLGLLAVAGMSRRKNQA